MTDTTNPTTNPAPTGDGKFALPATVYDVLKDIALIWLPALGTLYVALSSIWGFAGATQVAATVVAVDTFLGAVLKISQISFNNSAKSIDGTLHVDQSDPQIDKYSLDVTTPLQDVADADKITLKVDNQTPGSSMDPRNVKNS